ncbi:ATPase [Desulfoluna limicola]|uniref:ATPase n=1 Tax=Desulfoluna limicola TaxID=2810562 RepID=A0ABN6FA86_9BACT|nr:SbcC/MukB-like Walker B domain-containing protein [Desulfoluna limicola]BCS97430.1 ATPase [Desulfoluna limicola]
MKLHRIGVINFGNLPNHDYEFDSGVNMVTGHSAAGKSVLLDSIQSVLTATLQGAFQYNPGQEGTTQQSRTKESRSLGSYVLGCDDGYYARPNGAHCHLIAVFRPDSGRESGQSFTALFSATARLESSGDRRVAKEEDKCMAIFSGIELSYKDFLRKDQKEVVPVNELSTHFRMHLPEIRFEPAQTKTDYLCRLHGALLGKGVANKTEAINAARQWSRFMAYKPQKEGLDKFVRNEILEPEDLGEDIKQVSGMMRNINSLEQDARQIEEAVEQLHQARTASKTLIHIRNTDTLSLYENHFRNRYRLQQKHLELEKNRNKAVTEIRSAQSETESLEKSLKELRDQQVKLEAQALGMDSLKEKKRLEERIQELTLKTTNQSVSLLTENQLRSDLRSSIGKLKQYLDQTDPYIPGETVNDWQNRFQSLLETDDWDKLDLGGRIRQGDIEILQSLAFQGKEMDHAYQNMHRAFARCRETIEKTCYAMDAKLESIGSDCDRLSREIEVNRNVQQVSYPKDTARALELIRKTYPKSDPRVLCDHVEINDSRWQFAIEGLLGSNRFLILVEESHEARVMDLLKNHGLRRSAVVQGYKAQRDLMNRQLPAHSIIELMSFTHSIAKAYMCAHYGPVVQVDNIETLRTTGRGLMEDCRASSGYRMFSVHVKQEDLVFGAEARKRALEQKIENLLKLNQEKNDVAGKLRQIKEWRLPARKERPPQLGEITRNLVETYHQLQQRQTELGQLDLTEHQDLLNAIEVTREKITAFRKERDDAMKMVSTMDERLKQVNSDISATDREANREKKSIERHQSLLEVFETYWPLLNVSRELDLIEQACTSSGDLRNQYVQPIEQRSTKYQMKLNSVLGEFNAKSLRGITINYLETVSHLTEGNNSNHDGIVAGYILLTKLHRDIENTHNKFSNDILVNKKTQLEGISHEFKDIFVNNICYRLNSAIEKGKTRLETLNRRLKNYMFGEEYYQFAWKMIPEYGEYASFFQDVSHRGTKGELFYTDSWSEHSQEIFDRIRRLLISNDPNKSRLELKRLTDYRNYRDYDIVKYLGKNKVSLKKYGTGSGAQLETPSYVIKSAALGSALKFDEQDQALRMVVIDESFSTMDFNLTKTVLDYLSNKLGLQVIFVIPNTKSGAMHDVINVLYSVTKSPIDYKRGELQTIVHVDHTVIKKEPVRDLFNNKRVSIENKAYQLEFLEHMEETVS